MLGVFPLDLTYKTGPHMTDTYTYRNRSPPPEASTPQRTRPDIPRPDIVPSQLGACACACEMCVKKCTMKLGSFGRSGKNSSSRSLALSRPLSAVCAPLVRSESPRADNARVEARDLDYVTASASCLGTSSG